MGTVGRRRFKKWAAEVGDKIRKAIESVADGDLVRETDVAYELNSEGFPDPRVLRVHLRVERYGTVEDTRGKPAETPQETPYPGTSVDWGFPGQSSAPVPYQDFASVAGQGGALAPAAAPATGSPGTEATANAETAAPTSQTSSKGLGARTSGSGAKKVAKAPKLANPKEFR